MDKYLQYDHLELSEDPSFIRWAKGTETRDNNDWDGWMINHPEKVDDANKAKSIVLSMKFVEDNPSTEVENKIWNKISTNIKAEQSTIKEVNPRRKTLIRMLSYGAVAAVALILLIFNLGNNYDTSINVPFAQIKNVTLPDGSNVIINADSRIAYNKESWDKKRDVFLEGEAFFSVKKGAKFRVKTNMGFVHVLGTSFNVYSRNNDLSVQCETGKVLVQSSGVESTINPLQSVTVLDGIHQVDTMKETEFRSTWKKGIFVYKASLILDVVAELERQFEVKISMDKVHEEMKYTGSFNKSDLETALTEVFYPLDMKFELNGKNVTVTKK